MHKITTAFVLFGLIFGGILFFSVQENARANESAEERAALVAGTDAARSVQKLPLKHFQLRLKDLAVGEAGYIHFNLIQTDRERNCWVNGSAGVDASIAPRYVSFMALATRVEGGIEVDISKIGADNKIRPTDFKPSTDENLAIVRFIEAP